MQVAKVQDAKHESLAAIESLRQALDAAQGTGAADYVAQAQSSLGQMRAQIGDVPGALQVLSDAYQQARAENSPRYVASAGEYAFALEQAGQDEQALTIYR